MRNLATHNWKQVTSEAEEVAGVFLKFMNRALKLNQVIFDYKSYCKIRANNPDDRIRKKFNLHMSRKEKAEKKFKIALEKAIMSYAEKASSFFPQEQLEHRDIKFLSPPIVRLLFLHVYNEQLLTFLMEKYKHKHELRKQNVIRAKGVADQPLTAS